MAGHGARVNVDSAGTHGDFHAGQAPDARSCRHALRRGYDLSKLRARRIVAEDFLSFDLILAMDQENLDWLRAVCPPPFAYKLRPFMSFARNHPADQIPDPYNGGADVFELVLDLIEDAAAGLVESLASGQLSKAALRNLPVAQ